MPVPGLVASLPPPDERDAVVRPLLDEPVPELVPAPEPAVRREPAAPVEVPQRGVKLRPQSAA
jgi:hypothetical protein